tara:strand:- start:1124 stop:1357 length:234 start_codon:yes stop_codon:yes gene_type:complete
MVEHQEYEKLRKALLNMFASISNSENNVAQSVLEVDRLSREVIPEAPPMLRHYLERRSYQKALDFIDGRDESEKANC